MLRELAELTMLDEGDPQSFRVRAYESAAQAIAAQATDLGQADRRRSCRRSRASARAPRRRSASCSRPARCRSSRAARRSTRASVVALLRIQGLGPKALKRLRAELGVQSIDDLRRVLAEHKLRALKGFGAEVRGEARASARAPRRAGRGRAHADLGRAAARRAHRGAARARSPASRTPRTAARCAASPRRSATSTSWSRRARRRAGDGGARRDDRRRSRARRGETKTSVVTRRGTQIDLRVVARAPARRGAALLHRLEGPQHQAPQARARARLDAERVRALRDRGRQGRRQRDRGADLRGARPAVHPAGAARGRGRDRGRRERARCPQPIGDVDRRLPRAHHGLGRRALVARGGGRRGARRAATACSPSPITPRARSRASAARRSSSSARRSARCRPSSATRSRCCTASS